jgi:hypothetical protein
MHPFLQMPAAARLAMSRQQAMQAAVLFNIVSTGIAAAKRMQQHRSPMLCRQ